MYTRPYNLDKKDSTLYGFILFTIFCCISIFIIFYLYEVQLAEQEIKTETLKIKKNLVLKSKAITDLAKDSAKIAEEHYKFFKEGRLKENAFYKYLKYEPTKKGFHMDNLPVEFQKAKVGALTYLGPKDSLTKDKAIEINMALSLSDIFRMISDNITDSPWIYYTSDNFIFLTPFVSSKDFFFAKTMVEEKEFYKNARPEVNPNKTPFWTSAYIDEAGVGLMTTYSVPIYNNDRFLGAISIDVTIDQFNRILNSFSINAGEIFLFNEKKQLLASPNKVSSLDKNIKIISEYFENAFLEKISKLKNKNDNGDIFSVESSYIVKHDLPELQMTLFYKIDKISFWFRLLNKTKIFILLFIIGVILIIRNLRSMTHINNQQKALGLSQKLLTESEKIAKLCSWEFDCKNKTLIFSESFKLFFPNFINGNHIEFQEIVNWLSIDYQAEWERILNLCLTEKSQLHFEGILNTLPKDKSNDPRTDKYVSIIVKYEAIDNSHYTLKGTLQDITQRKELEKTIETERVKIIQTSKLAALGEMSAGIAHEINNPLAIIFANTNRLKRNIEPGTNEQAINSLNTIENMVKRITKIIKGLRTFARDADNDPFQNFLVQNLIEDIASICGERLKANSVEFILPEKFSPELTLDCNPTQITQVIINLIMNSFDSIHEQNHPWIKFDVFTSEDKIKFIITDSGKGISKEIADKIFQPFFTTKEVGKGTGIGLSISKGLVEAHKGTIFLDTTSENTKFVIELPLRHSDSKQNTA